MHARAVPAPTALPRQQRHRICNYSQPFHSYIPFTERIIVSLSFNGHCRQRILENKAKKPILTLFSTQSFTTASLLFKRKFLLVHFVWYPHIPQCQILWRWSPPTWPHHDHRRASLQNRAAVAHLSQHVSQQGIQSNAELAPRLGV
jgi:hypothetical protein